MAYFPLTEPVIPGPSLTVLLFDKRRALHNGVFYSVIFLLCLRAFWRVASIWGYGLCVLLVIWAWGGIMQAIQDYRYGFYDLDNPETPEEEALSEKSNWPLIPARSWCCCSRSRN